MDRTVFVEGKMIASPIVEAIKATNPQFRTHDPAFTENCQRCVSAYEARRRGYNVIAKPRILTGADSLPYMNSEKGWPAVYQDYRLESCAALTPELARGKVESLMKAYGDGSRAIVNGHQERMNIVDDFNAHNESVVQSPQKKSHKTVWTLLLAAIIALTCGYFGAYLANLQTEEKVIIQKVTVSDAENSVTPAVEVAKAISPSVVSITTEKMIVRTCIHKRESPR